MPDGSKSIGRSGQGNDYTDMRENPMLTADILNHLLDTLARPRVRILRRDASAFHICGCVGIVLAVCLAMSLVVHLGLSPWVMTGLVLAALATFPVLVMATKIVTGEENIIYYHHEIAVMIVSTATLRLSGQPVLPYLDIVILGIGAFLACGRIGCLMAGCCHGRPWHWGVCYRDEHAAVGFPTYLVGVRLFPVQAVESSCVLCIVSFSVGLIVSGQPPGETLAWYIVAYGIMRFGLEFLRGDPARPYLLGFSEAQWTSLLLMSALAWAETRGTMPSHLWHVTTAIGLALTMLAVTARRRLRTTPTDRLLHARHLKEVADAVEAVSLLATNDTPVSLHDRLQTTILVASTSQGIHLSASPIHSAAGFTRQYTLSSQNDPMTEEVAGVMAQLIVQLKHPAAAHTLIQGRNNIFHVLVQPAQADSWPRQAAPNVALENNAYAI